MLVIRMARVIQQCGKYRELHTIFLKNVIIAIIKLIVNLIMCGFSGKQKRIFNLSFCLGPNKHVLIHFVT